MTVAGDESQTLIDVLTLRVSTDGSDDDAVRIVPTVFTAVPEPGTIGLLLAGVGAIIGLRRRTSA
ncbi:MAG: PEP-CTERM sorting domain-containing protein [Burkholderiaceae bacterium]|nr:PEP-CTERM sorting domain-containing protein [Burkholderiaceae bacterium]